MLTALFLILEVNSLHEGESVLATFCEFFFPRRNVKMNSDQNYSHCLEILKQRQLIGSLKTSQCKFIYRTQFTKFKASYRDFTSYLQINKVQDIFFRKISIQTFSGESLFHISINRLQKSPQLENLKISPMMLRCSLACQVSAVNLK